MNLALLILDPLALVANIAIVAGAAGLIIALLHALTGGRCAVPVKEFQFRPRPAKIPPGYLFSITETMRRCRTLLDAMPDATDDPVNVHLERLIAERDKLRAQVSPDTCFNNPALSLIRDERIRQISAEGYTPEHDDRHRDGEIADAAACYAFNNKAPFRKDRIAGGGGIVEVPFRWPWDGAWWKPTPDDRVRELVKAGALIVAEIERLGRAKKGEQA